MLRFANYVFGIEAESNSDNENIDINCTEQDIDDDWILIDVSSGDSQKPTTGKELSNSANYKTTTNSVPRNPNIADAQRVDKSGHPDQDITEPIGTNAGQTMEESWFVTPPPCFNSLSHPVIIEETPLENLLIEHPSMSVFGPSLPPIDRRSSHRNSDSSAIPSPTNRSSNGTAVISTEPQSRRQLRQLRRQQQNALQNRNDNHTVNLHLRSGKT